MRIIMATISVSMFLTSWVLLIRFAYAHWATLPSGIRWEVLGLLGMLAVPLLASARDKNLGSYALAMAYVTLQYAVILITELLVKY